MTWKTTSSLFFRSSYIEEETSKDTGNMLQEYQVCTRWSWHVATICAYQYVSIKIHMHAVLPQCTIPLRGKLSDIDRWSLTVFEVYINSNMTTCKHSFIICTQNPHHWPLTKNLKSQLIQRLRSYTCVNRFSPPPNPPFAMGSKPKQLNNLNLNQRLSIKTKCTVLHATLELLKYTTKHL